jgi:hypothetical protein
MYVAVLGQARQQLDLGDREPGVPEQRESRGQVERLRSITQLGKGVGVANVRRRCVDPVGESPPEFGLPAQVAVDSVPAAVGVVTSAPVRQDARPLHGVRREEPRQSRGDGVPASLTKLRLSAGVEVAEVPRHRLAPGLVERGVEYGEQRPHHRVGRPGVVIGKPENSGDQRARRREPHAGAHPVASARRGAQPMREALREPSFDTLRRHDDKLFGERISKRYGEHVAHRVGEQVGSLGAMQVQGHRGSMPRDAARL